MNVAICQIERSLSIQRIQSQIIYFTLVPQPSHVPPGNCRNSSWSIPGWELDQTVQVYVVNRSWGSVFSLWKTVVCVTSCGLSFGGLNAIIFFWDPALALCITSVHLCLKQEPVSVYHPKSPFPSDWPSLLEKQHPQPLHQYFNDYCNTAS